MKIFFHNLIQKLYPFSTLVITLVFSFSLFILVEVFLKPLHFIATPNSYLVFHNIVEFFSIIVSVLIFSVSWYTRKLSGNKHILFLGILFLNIAIYDFFHTMTYGGMPNFITINSSNNGIQFWILARLVTSITFLISAFIPSDVKKYNLRSHWLLFFTLSLLCILSYGIFFDKKLIPTMYVEGVGLTPLKIFLEYVVIFIFTLAFISYAYRYIQTKNRVLLYYMTAFIVSIFSELSFTLYTSIYDTFNITGHVYKAIAFYLIFRGIFISSINEPYLKLSESGKWNEMLVNAAGRSGIGVIILQDRHGKQGLVISANDQACNILGYSEIALTKLAIVDIITPDELGKILSIYRDRQAGKIITPNTYETKLVRQDKTTIPVLVSSSTSTINGVLSTIVYFRDITENKLAQEALLLNEQRFRKIFNDGPIGMITIGKDLHFLTANEAFCKMIGYTQDELKQLTFADITHPDHVKQDTDSAKELLEGKIDKYHTEKRYICKDGNIIWVSLTVTIIKDENEQFHYFLSMIEDITERKQSEKELLVHQSELLNITQDLKREKAKSDSILYSIGEGLFVVDLEGKIILINQAFEKMLGWTADELYGQKFVDIIPAVDSQGNSIPANKRPVTITLTSGEATTYGNKFIDEYYLVRKDGSKFPINYHSSTVNINGKIIGAVGVFSDVTTFLEIDKAKTEFVSVVSHELRAPLGIMKAFNSMIFDGDYGPVNNGLKEPLTEIKNSTDHLITLVNDILNVSRIEAGKLLFKTTTFDTQKMILDTISHFKNVVEPEVSLSASDLSQEQVSADANKVSMILNNLLSNAVKFTHHGKIVVNSKVVDKTLNISVTDTGIGLTPEDQKNIFGKFQQITIEEFGKPPGTGLGLYFSKSLVEKMGGKIWLDHSEVGKGSTFIFSLPLAKNFKKKN